MKPYTVKVQRQFGRAAEEYDGYASVQRMMAEQLIEPLHLSSFPEFPRILEVGCGTGALTEMLVVKFTGASIVAVDLSSEMLAIAERRLRTSNNAPHVRLLQADIEEYARSAPAASFDLIISNACFQWLSTPAATLCRLQQLLCPSGSLVFSTFGPKTFRELHQAFGEVYRLNGRRPERHGIDFHSPDQWQLMLEAAGFHRVHAANDLWPEQYASPMGFLRSIKAVGASMSQVSSNLGLGSRGLIRHMQQIYQEKFRSPDGDGVRATYELVYVWSSKSR